MPSFRPTQISATNQYRLDKQRIATTKFRCRSAAPGSAHARNGILVGIAIMVKQYFIARWSGLLFTQRWLWNYYFRFFYIYFRKLIYLARMPLLVSPGTINNIRMQRHARPSLLLPLLSIILTPLAGRHLLKAIGRRWGTRAFSWLDIYYLSFSSRSNE